MVGWHHWFNGHELGQTPGGGEGQRTLVCYSPWGRKELDTTWWLNNNNRELRNLFLEKVTSAMRFQVWFQVWWYKYERKSKNKINHHESPRKTRWFGQSQRVSVGWWEKRLPGRLGLLFRILDSSDKESRQEKKKMEARPLSTDILPETRLLKISYK